MKALVKLYEIRSTWEELSELPPDQLALICLTDYVVSELNVLQRLYITSAHGECDIEAIDAAISIQRQVLMRSWSSKIFEFGVSINEITNGRTSVEDKAALELVKKGLEDYQSLKGHPGYSVARAIRNEASNHYPVDACKKNLARLKGVANCYKYATKMDGNSFFPLGEAAFFVGRFQRHSNSEGSDKLMEDVTSRWIEWNFAASEWVRKFQIMVFQEFFRSKYPDRQAVAKDYWVDPSLVEDYEPPSAPVFLKAPS